MLLFLITLLSFFIPTQLSLHFSNLSSTVYGFNIDYLIPTLYFTDIIIFFIIILGITKIKINRKRIFYCLLYLSFVAINIFISEYQIASVYRWIKISEMLMLGLVLINTKKFDIYRHFIFPLSTSVVAVCMLGIFQFFFKRSIGGLFYLLGERSLILNSPGISSYPYSTFPHPNAFAGFLLVFVLLLLQYKQKFNKKFFLALVLLIIINLIITNSLNVYLTIGVLLILNFKKNIAFSFFSIDYGARFITHRLELIKSSFQMIKENFLFGVGLNNFIPNLITVSSGYLNSWELQPVHNIFLLIFSETGVIGFVAFCLMLLSSFSITNFSLLAILFTGQFDHYWITLQQNMILLVFVLVLTKRNKNY